MKKNKQFVSVVLAFLLMFSCFGFTDPSAGVMAASVDYPAQLMNIASKDNSKVLAPDGTADNSPLSMKALGNDLAPAWRFDRVGKDSKGTFFKLVNAASGRLLTPNGYKVSAGNDVIMYGSESDKTQHWYIVPVKQDRLGNDLYYKIVNYSDTSLALTQGKSGMTLSAYTGADDQLWLLNSDGLQGFAGYCKNDNTGNIKAGDIGGLFGEVVEVTSFDELKKYAEADDPYTIIVKSNISVTTLKSDSQNHLYCPDGRIYVRSNKTIVGSYGNHSLNNVQFCTATKMGVGNNVIIRNLEMNHDAKSNGNDSIVVYFGSGENLWVDHVTFIGHSGYNTLGEGTPDWDKFLAVCYDADYCTVSDSSFGLHEYGLILGYPDDTEDSYKNKNNFPRMSIMGCKFKDTLTRAPGLMRYGYFHSLNNYVYNFSMAYTVHSDCKLFAESCYYDGASTKGNVVCDWNEVTHPGAFADSNSKGVNCKRLGIEGSAKVCSWRPGSNYSYTGLSADQAKNYCDKYSGCQSKNSDMMYLRYGKAGVPSAGLNTAPDGPMTPAAPTPASFPDGSCFYIQNAASKLYLTYDYENNTSNVVQSGVVMDADFNTWKLIGAGDDWYYLISTKGDGGTYVLDVEGKKAADGTNIDVYKYNGGENQKFRFIENEDGTYTILTKASGGKSAVEVASGSKEAGANVQQYTLNGAACQNWLLTPTVDPGAAMDTNVIYEFENVNSGMVMDIKDGKMSADTNVQQWGTNHYDCQRWKLMRAQPWSNGYYIISAADEGYALCAKGDGTNGTNISIQPFTPNMSTEAEFVFVKNLDGTYYIKSRSSNFNCFVEVGAASKESGANVQLWENTGSDCQKWNALTFDMPAPTEPPTEPPTEAPACDINGDGLTNMADLVLFSRYLLSDDTLTIDAYAYMWSAADLCNDGVLDVYDLIMLRKLVISL